MGKSIAQRHPLQKWIAYRHLAWLSGAPFPAAVEEETIGFAHLFAAHL
jgi:hypothetical protein